VADEKYMPWTLVDDVFFIVYLAPLKITYCISVSALSKYVRSKMVAKLKINHHGPRNICLLPDPSPFSLVTPFKPKVCIEGEPMLQSSFPNRKAITWSIHECKMSSNFIFSTYIISWSNWFMVVHIYLICTMHNQCTSN
jgi:hypothetical protein